MASNVRRGSPDPCLCDQRRNRKIQRGEPEGAKDYREIKRKIIPEVKMAKETWIQGQCLEVEAFLRKNKCKKAYQLVKDLTTEKQDTIEKQVMSH